MKDKIISALTELRKEEKRKFSQSVDLIINLQKYDLKKNQVNIFVPLPFKIFDKKICGFLETTSPQIDTITKSNYVNYKEAKDVKKLAEKYEFFIAQASVMPAVATTFGRVLGPVGKMPSPQLGILANPDEKSIKELVEKINKSVKIRNKEPSIKVKVGKESMKDEEIAENVMAVYNSVIKVLARGTDNIKNIELKFTMTKPVKLKLKEN